MIDTNFKIECDDKQRNKQVQRAVILINNCSTNVSTGSELNNAASCVLIKQLVPQNQPAKKVAQ